MKRIALVIAALALIALTAFGVGLLRIRTLRNVPYLAAGDDVRRLDLYLHAGAAPRPTLVYMHGGGWAAASHKEAVKVWHLPFLYLGWNFVNVEYRRIDAALAPAAVEDCACALRWVGANAALYHFDASRIVLMGDSAGGQLALATGFIPSSAGFGRNCPGTEPPKVAAIVDWAGTTDLTQLLDGANAQAYAVSWIGDRPDRDAVAGAVSPLRYVRAGLPPVFMVQARLDPVVPYTQSLMLRDALDRSGDASTLLTLSGRVHTEPGRLTALRVDLAIVIFLAGHGVWPLF